MSNLTLLYSSTSIHKVLLSLPLLFYKFVEEFVEEHCFWNYFKLFQKHEKYMIYKSGILFDTRVLKSYVFGCMFGVHSDLVYKYYIWFLKMSL